ncbi:MAG: M20/M25/M40 family metallo-hydrolase [Gemmatimonadetes bacterium]|nr:M20/M25/M40 family metallo-hydrolase [Gemmatimonadota bacterium]
MRRRSLLLLLLLTLIGNTALTAQGTRPATSWNPALMQRPDMKAALAQLDRGFPAQVEEWIALTQMPGLSRHEEVRGAYVRKVMEAEGLEVRTDSIGNVTGVRRGRGGGPSVVIAVHMDVVHDPSVVGTVRRMGDSLHAPGIFDNTAGVANMLAMIRAMNAAKVVTRGDIVFVATTQEEIGLKGMEYWLQHNARPDLLIAIDGGLGPVNYGALGIYWTRYVYTSPGSHTLFSRGRATPVKAMATAIRDIYALEFGPLPDGAVINVGQVHGGVIYNGIPQEMAFTVDLRSPDPVLLDSLDKRIERIAREAATKEGVGFRMEAEVRNGAGGTAAMLAGARAHPLVQTAIDIHHALGITMAMPGAEEAIPTGSTDANLGVVRKIPSISIGRAAGTGQHTLTESAQWPSALPATKMAMLLAVTMADMARAVP